MTTVGKRLLKARKLRGFSQVRLAGGTSNSPSLISMVESGRANLSVASLTASAKALGVSVDFLCGLTADPTPARQLATELADSTTRIRDLEAQQAYLSTATDDGDYVGVSELAGAAGGGAVVDHERITGRVKFRREWLARHGLPAGECRVIRVLGESMEPTLVDGCSILVNQASQRRREGRTDLRRADRGRPRRQARRQGPRRRLAARQRQPEQAGMADHALAGRRAGGRRGRVGRADVRVTHDPTQPEP